MVNIYHNFAESKPLTPLDDRYIFPKDSRHPQGIVDQYPHEEKRSYNYRKLFVIQGCRGKEELGWAARPPKADELPRTPPCVPPYSPAAAAAAAAAEDEAAADELA